VSFSRDLTNETDFTIPSERTQLLAVKGVGPTVVARLEQIGFESLQHLAKANALDILAQGAKLTGSSCWKNSPQARAAINAAIEAAKLAIR
jgi:DNA polymerase/3'-5' exonuclease PolX